MPVFEIKSWLSTKILFTMEAENHKQALETAVQRGADLQRADLQGADLQGARLQGADLQRARLQEADLQRADLRGADLQRADLRGARLRGARLRGARLRGADLIPIRDDLWAVLSAAPAEVPGLRDALLNGRIDGAVYEGECACLVGTLANIRGCDIHAIPGLQPSSNRPAERWFLQIKPGDLPETSEPVCLTLEWIETWLTNMRAAFGTREPAEVAVDG